MHVTLAQIAPRLGRLDDNVETHRDIIREAWAAGSDLLIFPELSLTGYLLRDFVPQVALPSEQLCELLGGLEPAPSAAPLDVVLGFVELSVGHVCYNAAAYLRLEAGQAPTIVSVHRKVHLPTYGMFDERRYFAPGLRVRAFDSPTLGRTGMLVCEDLWHPPSVFLMALDGPDYEGAQSLIAIANSPARNAADTERFTVANLETWRRLNLLYAQLYGMVVFHCQRVGVEDSYIYTGGSEIVAPSGEILARGALFEEELVSADIDFDDILRWHRSVHPMTLSDDVGIVSRELGRIVREAQL